MEPIIVRHPDRYALMLGGDEIGELDYHDDSSGRRILPHVGVRPAHEGHGLAAQLTRRALDDARADGRTVVPICPYIAAYLRRHPGDVDLVDPEYLG